jgi:Flp pilus assembly protein TadD
MSSATSTVRVPAIASSPPPFSTTVEDGADAVKRAPGGDCGIIAGMSDEAKQAADALALARDHYRAGRSGEAAFLCDAVLARDPGSAEAWHLLGLARRQAGDAAGAVAAITRALELAPGVAAAHFNLGNALAAQGRNEEAAARYRQALTLAPGFGAAHNNLGSALERLGRLAEAAAHFERAVALSPDDAEAALNLCSARHGQGRLEEALALARRAVQLKPDFAEGQWNEAVLLLTMGDLEAGFTKHEWRWRVGQIAPRDLPGPVWQGESLAGRTILTYAEQGFGDTIQFLRYVPMLAAQGARVVVEVPKALARLAGSVAGASTVVAQGAALPDYDCQCALASLPLRFGTGLATIPADIPYLAADAAALARWRLRIGSGGRRIGLVWAGSPLHRKDAQRSIPIELLAPLLDLPDTAWFSLQVGERAPDLAKLPPGRVVDLAPELGDFAETAAALEALDLVIGVDTAVLHLAGALGRPGFLLLPFTADWRWLTGRADSPWYPSLQLFRQKSPGDWAGAIARVGAVLAG